MKVNEKAKELGITIKELLEMLTIAGYTYTNATQTLKPDALQYLELDFTKPEIKIENGFRNAVVVADGESFAVITLLINSKLDCREISRKVFDSKVRAYYELNYLIELFELDRA
jgi:hypothetical protein